MPLQMPLLFSCCPFRRPRALWLPLGLPRGSSSRRQEGRQSDQPWAPPSTPVWLGQAGCDPALPVQLSLSRFWVLHSPLELVSLLNCPHCPLCPAASLIAHPSAKPLCPHSGLCTPTPGHGSPRPLWSGAPTSASTTCDTALQVWGAGLGPPASACSQRETGAGPQARPVPWATLTVL